MQSNFKYPAKLILRVCYFSYFLYPKLFVFRYWIYSFYVSSLLLISSRALSPGFSLKICSASNVKNLFLLLAWSMIFQLNSELKLSPPHSFRYCPTGESAFRCSLTLVVRCLTIWPTKMDLRSLHSNLYTTLDFSSHEKADLNDG